MFIIVACGISKQQQLVMLFNNLLHSPLYIYLRSSYYLPRSCVIEAVMELNGKHAEALKEIDTFMFDCDGKFYKIIW